MNLEPNYFGQEALGVLFGLTNIMRLNGKEHDSNYVDFQNPDEWIYTAIDRALKSVDKIGLDVQIVSYGRSERSTRSFIERRCI